jgi:hypothetical protein
VTSSRHVLALIGLAAVGCASAPPAARNIRWATPRDLDRSSLATLVGVQRSDSNGRLPDHTGRLASWLLGGPRAEFSTRFAISEFRRGRRHYLTFDSLVTNGGRHAVWKVLDAIWIPTAPASLVFSRACASEAQLQTGDLSMDRGLGAIAVVEEAETFSHVLFAWRADTVSLRFQVASPAGLRCENASWELP